MRKKDNQEELREIMRDMAIAYDNSYIKAKSLGLELGDKITFKDGEITIVSEEDLDDDEDVAFCVTNIVKVERPVEYKEIKLNIEEDDEEYDPYLNGTFSKEKLLAWEDKNLSEEEKKQARGDVFKTILGTNWYDRIDGAKIEEKVSRETYRIGPFLIGKDWIKPKEEK